MASAEWLWNSSIRDIELSSSFPTREVLFCLLFYFPPRPPIQQRGVDLIMDGRRPFVSTTKPVRKKTRKGR